MPLNRYVHGIFISFWEFQYWKVTEKYFKREKKNHYRLGISLTGYLDKRMKNSHEQVGKILAEQKYVNNLAVKNKKDQLVNFKSNGKRKISI